jgi:hypothetical protein
VAETAAVTLAELKRVRAWAVFLLCALAIITVIDLELKRQIGRQAVTAANLLGQAVSGERREPPVASADAGRVDRRDSGAGVDGASPGSPADAGLGDEGTPAKVAAPRRAQGRSRGDGK